MNIPTYCSFQAMNSQQSHVFEFSVLHSFIKRNIHNFKPYIYLCCMYLLIYICLYSNIRHNSEWTYIYGESVRKTETHAHSQFV